jgi:hypothetical protein
VLCRVRHDVPDEIASSLGERVEDAAGRDPDELTRDLARLLEPRFAIGARYAGPAFRFPEDVPEARETTRLRRPGDARLDGFPGLAAELRSADPCLASVVDGRAVAICRTVRRTARVVEAGVETLFEHRRRGHGLRVVSAWAAAVRELGLEPLYSTARVNRESRGLAARLGLIHYASDLHLSERRDP